MLSNNAMTFVAAAKVVTEVVTSPKVQEYFVGIGIQWKFNVPRAPWLGGVFERLVHSTKWCLSKVLGQAKFSHDELLTALIEIEMALNSRPLTYISEKDLDEALAPSHLLIGRRLMNLPDHVLQPNHVDNCDEKEFKLNSRVKHLNRSLNCFWKRWRREYLLELQEAHRLRYTHHGLQMSQGDIVVVNSGDQPRSCWKIGRVEHIIEGADGHARAAMICVSGKGRIKILNRYIQYLIHLQ